MKVSVITVCYNSASTIRDTIESVIAQDYEDLEYILVDGGSTDTTMDIVSQFDDGIDVIISEPDEGIYDAMNKGIKAASGDIVGTLNSDDLFTDDRRISELAAFLDANPELDGAYGDLVFVRRDDVDSITRRYSSKLFSTRLIRFGLMLPHPTFYVKRSLFERLGFYRHGYRVAADFELITRFLKNGVRLGRIGQVMVKMREGGISTTGLFWRIHQNMEIVRACRENGISTNIFLVALKLPIKLAGYIFTR